MASTINASTSAGGGIIQTADASGVLALQAAGTTIASVSSTGVAINGSTSGSITLSAPAVAGTNTLTLPASSGTVALTSQIGGFTHLGTLTTTSGTSQTFSGLNLTGYKLIFYYVINSSHNAATARTFRVGGINISASTGLADAITMFGFIELITGYVTNLSLLTGGGSTGYSTATTSITFDWGGTTAFDSGSIQLYGVR